MAKHSNMIFEAIFRLYFHFETTIFGSKGKKLEKFTKNFVFRAFFAAKVAPFLEL